MIINTVTKLYSAISNTFSSYQIEYENGTIVSVPLDTANSDYQAIMEYIENGGVVIDNGGGE